MPNSTLVRLTVVAGIFCASAAGSVISPPSPGPVATLSMTPLTFNGVNGSVSLTENFYVLEPSQIAFVEKVPNGATNVAPRCHQGELCNGSTMVLYSIPSIGFFHHEEETYVCGNVDPRSCVENYSVGPNGGFVGGIFTAGTYSITFQITDSGSPNAFAAHNFIGMDLVVLSGSASLTPSQVVANPEPGTFVLVAASALLLWYGVRRKIHRRAGVVSDPSV